MKIKIRNNQGLIKEVEINGNITLGKAKEKSNEIDNQWMYNGEVLIDDKTLFDYDIEEGSLIISITQNNTDKIRIKIRNAATNMEKNVEINLKMTIKEAKEKFDELDKIWSFNGEILRDQTTFEYYGVEEYDVILSLQKILGGLIQKKI